MRGNARPLRVMTARFASSRHTRIRTFVRSVRGAEPVESSHAGWSHQGTVACRCQSP